MLNAALASPSQSTGGAMAAGRGIAVNDDDPENKGYLPVTKLHKQVSDYLLLKEAEIEEQKEGRRYYHCAQWTERELQILAKRNQAAITYNRIGRKINQICGVVQRQRQDPKAFPRTPKHEDGAELATAVIRYVLDANLWKTTDSECIRKAGYEGLTGVELNLIRGDRGDPDVSIAPVDGENYFYDANSVKPDFADKKYDGIMKWKDLDDVIEMFPDCEEDLRALVGSGSDLSSNSDRENKLTFRRGHQVRLIEHWYKYKGRWCYCFYVAQTMLDEGESPFFDEKGQSMSRFVMFSAAVDQDGDRYGFVRNLRGAQDEMNHRRSSGLYRSVSRQMKVLKGAVDDVERARSERAKPDGVIEINTSQAGMAGVEFVDQSADVAAQRDFWLDARDEIQNFANVDAAAMQGVAKNLSGRAINLLQQPGMAELEPFINAVKGWKLRLYRTILSMVQRYWSAERWIRVTDDNQISNFLQVNGMELDESGLPTFVNALGNLDVDIVLDEGPDTVNMMADAYDMIANDPSFPAQVKIELMPGLPGSLKQKVLKLLQPQPPNPADIQAKQIALAAAEADVEVRHSTAMKNRASAVQSVATAAANAAKAMLPPAGVWQEGVQDAPLVPAQGNQPSPDQMPVAAMPPAPTGMMGGPPQPPGVGPHLGSASGGQAMVPPHLGPRVAPDGKMYVSDPTRPGKYMMVA